MEPEKILFIYDDDPTSRKQARRHVSRVVRRREHQRRARSPFIQNNVPHRARPNLAKDTTETEVSLDSNNLLAHASENLDRTKPLDEVQRSAGTFGIFKYGNPRRNRRTSQYQGPSQQACASPSPRSPVDPYFSAARSDPFCSLPVTLDPESAKCLDHFNTSMPYLEFSVHEGAPLIPSRHVAFRSALETPAALHAIIATGATHLASLYGVETSRTIQYHVGRGLKLLREILTGVTQDTWAGVAQAMTEMAAGDDFRGQIQNSRIHLSGLRELLRAFGGVANLKATPRIQLLICYVLNSCTAPYFPTISISRVALNRLQHIMCNDKVPCSLTASDLIVMGINNAQGRALLDLYSHVHDFCRFMNKISSPSNDDLNTGMMALRNLLPRCFDPTNKLRQRLAIAALDQERFGGLGPKGHHRVACLFTIALQLVGLADAADFQGITLYLEKLQYLHQPNLRLLQFILLQNGTEVRMNDVGLSWEVTRFMQVYKLMKEDWRRIVNDALVGLLTGGEEWEGGEGGYMSGESPERERFAVYEVMHEVLGNLVHVIGEERLIGYEVDLESAPIEEVREVT